MEVFLMKTLGVHTNCSYNSKLLLSQNLIYKKDGTVALGKMANFPVPSIISLPMTVRQVLLESSYPS